VDNKEMITILLSQVLKYVVLLNTAFNVDFRVSYLF